MPLLAMTSSSTSDPDSPASSSSASSESSTPLTEVSNLPGSPQLAPLMDTEEIRRRREQSDRASHEIGNRLLQGWTMLADECPSPTCYGIPLVRPPKAGGETDSRKECVICRTVYTPDVNQTAQRQPPISSRGAVPNSKVVPAEPTRFAGNSLRQSADNTYDETETLRALEESSKSLQITLRALSTRILSLSRQGTPVEPTSISSTAEAMMKVTQALSQVKQLEWSERQLHSL